MHCHVARAAMVEALHLFTLEEQNGKGLQRLPANPSSEREAALAQVSRNREAGEIDHHVHGAGSLPREASQRCHRH